MAWIVQDRTKAPDRRDEPYLHDALRERLESTYAHRYPTRQAMSLPVLHALQHEIGWLPAQAIEEAAAFVGVEPSVMYDTATFYEEYFTHEKGEHVVWVCQSVACEIMGEAAVTDALREKYGVDPEQTTPDGKLTLMKVECIGACGGAPCMLVDETLHEDVTPEKAGELVEATINTTAQNGHGS